MKFKGGIMYRKNMYIKLFLVIFIELLIIYFCFISKEKIITTFIFCITLLSLIVSYSYAINLWEFHYNHKDYIDEIIKYKKGYTFKVRISKDIKEDIIFIRFVSKNMKDFKKIINYGTDKLIYNFNIKDITIYTTGGYVENLVFDFKLKFSNERFKIRLTFRVCEGRQETSENDMISMFDRQLNDIKIKTIR